MKFKKFIRFYYNKVIESIAFYPAIIAVGFLLLSWIMLEIDFSETGKAIKSQYKLISLKDATTARTIISTVAAAIISLTVFSFSMVMIVLNQAASQMSNRVLSSMIENRFQQMILGVYIGTIVYALFLLSTIRDIESGILVPALSIYLLVFLTVIDIFLFIYFLDYVTQTVKYETVIDRVRSQTMEMMVEEFVEVEDETASWESMPYVEIKTLKSGYFQSFNEYDLLRFADEKNFYISFVQQQSSYLLKDTILMKVYSEKPLEKDDLQSISDATDFYSGQPIDINADYGFRQLAEISMKALSPGINDPGTAVISLHSIFALLAFRLNCKMPCLRKEKDEVDRIFIPTSTFLDIFEKCIPPIWNYGKEDQYIQNELLGMLLQLNAKDSIGRYTAHFEKWIAIIESKISNTRL